MSNDTQFQSGCNESYAKLCALSTTGELTVDESAELQRHVAVCGLCATLLREYNSLTSVGMAKLASEWEPEHQKIHPYSEKKAEQRLTAALRAARSGALPQFHSPVLVPASSGAWKPGIVFVVGAAAVVLLTCVGGAFELGRKTEGPRPQTGMVTVAQSPAPVPDAEEANLRQKLSAVQMSLDETTARSADAEKRATELSDTRASLLVQLDELSKKDQATSEALVASAQQRDSLQQQLNDTSKSLQQVKDDLTQARQDRQGAVLRAASLEQQVDGLRSTLAMTDKAASTNESFLAQDRDIRELMGARQLYIADVVDVQSDGERSKPFGRVFYTKGKSLIFYAFDLQAQPGYREAKTFQAWGKPDNPSGKAISLGIFYMDNEKNRRWALKSDNPEALAQINAVFVTVEPKGGSLRPTGKPFLEAYLHTLPPNHP